MMLVAVPSNAPGGLDAEIADHFGHCDSFTMVQVDDEQLGEVTVLKNDGHAQGGCMAPVMLLKQNGAEAMVTGGMGMRPLAGFQEVGIKVYFKDDASTVREAVERIIAGKCREFGEEHACGGHEGGCGGHHDHEIQLEPVDGPVAEGLVVNISYELFDGENTLIDSSEARYLQGHQQIAPGLERALEGHEVGDELEVTVAPQDGWGERDESKIITAPADKLPEGATVGETIQAQLPDGSAMNVTITSIEGDVATLDSNHPLAGQTVVFKVKVLGIAKPVS